MVVPPSSCIVLAITNRTSFEKVCRDQKDAKTKERILLVLNVVYYGRVTANVAERQIHNKSKGRASEWLKRYTAEVKGKKDCRTR